MAGFGDRLNSAVNERLRDLRALIPKPSKPLSLKTVAEVAGVDHGNLHKFTKGKKAHPSADTAFRLARTLDVSLVWLITGVEPSGLNHPMATERVAAFAVASAGALDEAEVLRTMRGSLRPNNFLGPVGDHVDEKVEGGAELKVPQKQEAHAQANKHR